MSPVVDKTCNSFSQELLVTVRVKFRTGPMLERPLHPRSPPTLQEFEGYSPEPGGRYPFIVNGGVQVLRS